MLRIDRKILTKEMSLPTATIAFALESNNPWHDHLGTLADHLGVTSYYTILTDKQSLPEVLERLPGDVKLVLISSTDPEQPTTLEDYKSSEFEGRVVSIITPSAPEKPPQDRQIIAPSALTGSRDIHRHIMGFLPESDIIRSASVSRDWKRISDDDWRLWLQIANRDNKSLLGMEEFRSLGRTPVLAYQQLAGIQRLNEAIIQYTNVLELSFADPDDYSLVWDAEIASGQLRTLAKNFDFIPEINPGSVILLLAVIKHLKKSEIGDYFYEILIRRLRYELGRRGSAQMIVEYVNILSDVFRLFDGERNHSDDPGIRERLTSWVTRTPERTAMRTLFLETGEDFETASDVWYGLDDRPDKDVVFLAISKALSPERFEHFKEVYQDAIDVRPQ